jgi:hypothetical protein
MIDWVPNEDLEAGLVKTFNWINEQITLDKQDVE